MTSREIAHGIWVNSGVAGLLILTTHVSSDVVKETLSKRKIRRRDQSLCESVHLKSTKATLCQFPARCCLCFESSAPLVFPPVDIFYYDIPHLLV